LKLGIRPKDRLIQEDQMIKQIIDIELITFFHMMKQIIEIITFSK
jgi:hypothetical protein